jgi:hypothetical protein
MYTSSEPFILFIMITNNVLLLAEFLSRNLMIIITGRSDSRNGVQAGNIVGAYQDICDNNTFLLIEDGKLFWEDALSKYTGTGLVVSAGSPHTPLETKRMLLICKDELKLETVVFHLEEPDDEPLPDIAIFKAQDVPVYSIDSRLGPDIRRAILQKLTDHCVAA